MKGLKFSKFISIMALAGAALVSAALVAEPVYVVSPAAKLMNEPKMGGGGSPLQPGTELNKVGEQGMFVKVQGASGTGYVSKLFVSQYAPTGKVDTTKIRLNQQVATRDQASSYSQTAAARGFSSGSEESFDNPKAFDFDQVDWLEKQKPSEKQVDIFLRQGNLHKFGP